MTFGRSTAADGPTLFDGLDLDADPTPTIVVEAVPESAFTLKRRATVAGQSRRIGCRPEVIDPAAAEKVCPVAVRPRSALARY